NVVLAQKGRFLSGLSLWSAALESGFIFSLIFSKKIYHRRSLYHTSSDVYRRFALQIYIIVGCAYP
ncbi:MAG: hypothetical protein IJP27_08630, partial [Clostridia bacterium]|nr:hypothetical protein [Clostridia bacterium]